MKLKKLKRILSIIIKHEDKSIPDCEYIDEINWLVDDICKKENSILKGTKETPDGFHNTIFSALLLGREAANEAATMYHIEMEGWYPDEHRLLDENVASIDKAITLYQIMLDTK